MPDTRSMSSPKLLNELYRRCFNIGTSGFVSMLRKKRRTRVEILFSMERRDRVTSGTIGGREGVGR
jgi:hypothetical protein